MSKYKGLTKKGFSEWLATKAGNEEVGFVAHTCNCPIATYMNETNSDKAFSVGTKYLQVTPLNKDTKGYNLPNWAEKFVSEIDETGNFQTPVLACTAKEILDGI